MSGPVAIFAPGGRDSTVMLGILEAAGIPSKIVDPAALVKGIEEARFAVALLTEEALTHISGADLLRSLANQPPWSDFPFIVLTAKGVPTSRTRSLLLALGNFVQVERPVHPATLVGTLRSAVRARGRQLEAKVYLEARQDAEGALRVFANTLEQQVGERTVALAKSNERLSAEIEEKVKAQQDVQRMQAELIHISRVSAMGTMASTIAHELNQPLTAVINYVRGSKRMLESGDAPVSVSILEALDAAALSAHRAGEIVRHLRELVSRGTITKREENLPQLIEEALRLGMVDAAAQGVSLSMELDPEAAVVLVDRIQIQQVIINLLRNAMDAMRATQTREIVLRTIRRKDRMAEITVSDSGPGLPPEVLPSLFSPFSTTKNDGMGIGLSISRTIIEAHGGVIAGFNGPNGGATFCFTVPLESS